RWLANGIFEFAKKVDRSLFEFSSDGSANTISRKEQNLLTKSGILLTRPKTLAKSLLTEKVIGQCIMW
ncbi:hypothetical protein, partial [Allofournierella massiliensis]|uniref:hypothetical protein n=1 Tax=Allofournierella massiliensis TaxID=1650663 RepID=UPI0035663415